MVLLGAFLFLAWGPGGGDLGDNDTVPYLGTAEVARAVSESPHEELVFLYNGNEVTPLLHALCRPTSWRDYATCIADLSEEHPKGWAVLSGAVAGRRLHALKPWGGAGPDEQQELFLQMAEGWGVRGRPHGFLVTRGRRAPFGDAPAWTATECAPGTETRGFILYECPGVAAPPRRPAPQPR